LQQGGKITSRAINAGNEFVYGFQLIRGSFAFLHSLA
jgi:hypothetical protein